MWTWRRAGVAGWPTTLSVWLEVPLAAGLMVLSPLYLEGSRIALAEVPALAPAALSVACAIVYAREGRRRWLVAAALLLATSLLVKPITLAAGVPFGLAILSRWRV